MLFNNSASSVAENKTLFVGCMDPKTNEEALLKHFGAYDSCLQVKLLWNHQTNTSKQCALLFCSSFECANMILSAQHRIHDRNLRVRYADEEKKGTKAAQLFYVQVTGIPVDTPDEEIELTFSQYPDYHSFRFIQGTHHKQKWVAKVAFKNQASIKNLLAAQTHVIIAQKLCKIVEFQPKGSISANSDSYSTTKSSYDENEHTHKLKKLDQISLSHGKFQSPFSYQDMCSMPPPYQYPGSFQELQYLNPMHKSMPGEPPSRSESNLYKLSASSPHGDLAYKCDASKKLTRQIFLPELTNEEDDDLLKLFASPGSTNK
jgi:RNA recognition motif-containing protein